MACLTRANHKIGRGHIRVLADRKNVKCLTGTFAIMKNVRFRPRAWEDIQESAEYLTVEASVEVAERFLSAIDELTHKLAHLPQMGTACHFRNLRLRGVRRLPVAGFEKWLVFYQASDDGVEIVRVLHGARDLSSILDSGPSRL